MSNPKFLISLALIGLAAPGIAAAADGPGPAIQPGVAIEGEAVEANLAPSLPIDEATLPEGVSMLPQEVPADDQQKGSVFTNAGEGLTLPAPDALALEKLAMARRAVEASRLAGTLYQAAIAAPADVFAPADLEAIKQQRLETLEPQVLPPDPAAMVGDFAPVQEIGAPGLTPEEEAKLAGTTQPADPAKPGDAGTVEGK
jgi:hypothetical protein